ncbi:Hypothetical predicted protein [Octopus vulgaris]|uniref:SAM domain-containing protein n=1 Tax=Octopus vulgaris TaxID=6645 RepID=A0AA36B1A1_OCTVU|nr:Hypothetical predicted protein [Octopus vulgaris]
MESNIEENQTNLEECNSALRSEKRETNLADSRGGGNSISDSRGGRYSLSNSRDERYSLSDSRGGRYSLSNSRDERYSLSDSRGGRYSLSNSRDEKYSLSDSRDGTYTKHKTAPHTGRKSSVKSKVQRHLSLTLSAPELEVEIPRDGSLLSFATKDIVTILICLNIDPEIIDRVNKMHLNGKKLSALSNDDLKELGINNPIVKYFRDRTKVKSKSHFML